MTDSEWLALLDEARTLEARLSFVLSLPRVIEGALAAREVTRQAELERAQAEDALTRARDACALIGQETPARLAAEAARITAAQQRAHEAETTAAGTLEELRVRVGAAEREAAGRIEAAEREAEARTRAALARAEDAETRAAKAEEKLNEFRAMTRAITG